MCEECGVQMAASSTTQKKTFTSSSLFGGWQFPQFFIYIFFHNFPFCFVYFFTHGFCDVDVVHIDRYLYILIIIYPVFYCLADVSSTFFHLLSLLLFFTLINNKFFSFYFSLGFLFYIFWLQEFIVYLVL